MMFAYKEQAGVEIRIARIFNTFGPRMHPNDGRVVSNFIIQALQNKDITVYGSGHQTRSFQYVDDLVEGLITLMNSEYDMPVNLGNPDEYTVGKFAETIKVCLCFCFVFYFFSAFFSRLFPNHPLASSTWKRRRTILPEENQTSPWPNESLGGHPSGR